MLESLPEENLARFPQLMTACSVSLYRVLLCDCSLICVNFVQMHGFASILHMAGAKGLYWLAKLQILQGVDVHSKDEVVL